MPASLKNTTVKYFTWDNPKKYPVEKALIEKFEKDTGVKVAIEVGDYAKFVEQLNVKIASGSSPDVVRLLTNDVFRVNSLQPLQNTGFNFNDTAWDQTTMKDFTFGGKAYATNLVKTHQFNSLITYYNKKLIEDEDLQDPAELWKTGRWTWAKFEEISKDFIKGNKSVRYGASFCPFQTYSLAMGVDLIALVNGKYVSKMTDPKLAAAWKQHTEWVKDRVVSPTVSDVSKFMGGQILFIMHQDTGLITGNTFLEGMKAQGILGYLPLPTTDGKAATVTALQEYSAFGVPQNAPNLKAVPYFLRCYLDRDAAGFDSFISKEAKALIDQNIARPTRTVILSGMITADSGGYADAIPFFLNKADPKQVAAELAGQRPVVEDAVNKANILVSRMK
jgi:ABC-type glycerol-3-phosphate transport system substrate-binding protein